jgi:ABC-2 type transport system ATP-binding protein
MIQRVGLAQALINDPEVVFLDEPMSGLDPIGRREVRDIMLRLRDRGTTVFFSSHILADAEAICTSVGIVSAGRLAAAGRISDLVSPETRGWQLVVSGLDSTLMEQLVAEGAAVSRDGAERHLVTLPGGPPPDAILARLKTSGAGLISLTAVKESLEDVFLARVREQGSRDVRQSPAEQRAG